MRKKVRTLLAMLLVIAMLSGIVSASASYLNGFDRTKTYTYGMFTDVQESEKWYGADNQHVVKDVYELGIMDGVDLYKFDPEGKLTIAQAVTMAARVHASYNGNKLKASAYEKYWYEPYIAYAVDNGILAVAGLDYDDPYWNENATRYDMASIFYRSVPAEELPPINDITSIPDFTDSDEEQTILSLYRAGILTGTDDEGSFCPTASVTRAEAAAIISRVIITENRIDTRYQKPVPNDALLEAFLSSATVYNEAESRIRRWESPIILYIYGDLTAAEYDHLDRLITAANGIEGFPGIGCVDDPDAANMIIAACDSETITALNGGTYAPVLPGIDFADEEMTVISSAFLILDSTIDEEVKLIFMSQLFLGMLGLTGSNSYTDGESSVICSENTSNYTLTPCDIGMLRLLYNPLMPGGASAEEARDAAERIMGI